MVYHMRPENPIRKRKSGWVPLNNWKWSISLSIVQIHWFCPLHKLSTCSQQIERIKEHLGDRCLAVLRLVEKNLKLVKQHSEHTSFVSRSSMCCSTKSSAFTQQRSTCWAHARAVPSVSFTLSHEPLLNLRTAQHVESLLRSFEHRAQQHLNKHSTCWEPVQLTNLVHLHAATNLYTNKKVLRSLQHTVS